MRLLPQDYTVAAGHRIGLRVQSSNTVWAVPGNPGAVDVAQGALGNCHLLASVMAVSRINPSRIRRLIRGPVHVLPDGRRIFEVDLFESLFLGVPVRRTNFPYSLFLLSTS